MNIQEKDMSNQPNNDSQSNSFEKANRDPNPLYSPDDSLSPVNNPAQSSDRSIVDDERDGQIKNEPDTARLGSERQSVKDAENKKDDAKNLKDYKSL